MGHRQLIRLFFIFTLVIGVGSGALKAQDEQKNSIIEQRIEAIAAMLEEDAELDFTTLFDDLAYFYEHPLNLNAASVEELESLYMFSDLQIQALMRHLERFGPLASVYELQAINYFDLQTIRMVAPFVTVLPPAGLGKFKLSDLFSEGSNDLFLRYKRVLEDQAGYQSTEEDGVQVDPAFRGTPDYGYLRYRYQFRRSLTLGITAEKDAGEDLVNGPDFFSGHLMFKGKRWLRTLIVGDYNAQFGQGLTYWSGLGFGKSPYVTNLKKNASQLRPYTSVDENRFLRGGAVILGSGKMELTLFGSSKRIDGNLTTPEDSTLAEDEFSISSFQTSGLHRTEGEWADRKSVEEFTTGGNFRYRKRAFSAGVTGVYTSFGNEVTHGDRRYQQFDFSGKENVNTGADYQWVVRNVNLFGEVARSRNGAVAWMNGLVAALHPRLSVSLLYRDYPADYQSFHVNVFGETNDRARNERGLYMAAEAKLASAWTLAAYADQVQFPWFSFVADGPSRFSDYFVQLNCKPDKKHEFYLRYRWRRSEQNYNTGEPIDYPIPYVRHNVRVHAVYTTHPNVQFKSRFEWNMRMPVGGTATNGYLLYQDVIWKKLGSPVSLQFRYALFNTPAWDVSIYAYETDVLYAYSIPAYSGKGSRFYGMMKWAASRSVDVWLRYGQWLYDDRTVISSGNTRIDANHKQEIHMQLRWQF
ncbi:MAG: helix-hairpin-helix domain-containing protein [Flavobacteriales bacterium]|nr:helix-hairpin-helix domain-containing protein [Flavobacteriales bacterium]